MLQPRGPLKEVWRRKGRLIHIIIMAGACIPLRVASSFRTKLLLCPTWRAGKRRPFRTCRLSVALLLIPQGGQLFTNLVIRLCNLVIRLCTCDKGKIYLICGICVGRTQPRLVLFPKLACIFPHDP